MKTINLTLVLFLSFLITSCAEKPELLANNNPDKYTVVKDVQWASPDGFPLTMDIYTPKTGKETYPVIVIFHGGGWLINDKSIMDQMSKYLVTNSEYVVCNVNYRLLVDNGNTVKLNQIVEDVFGSILWVKDNISRYGGDKDNIAVTGDSAGGHLSAMVVNMGHRLSSELYSEKELGFTPSYLPSGKTAEDIANQNGLEVQAAILSYGAFNIYEGSLNGFEEMTNPFWVMGGSMARGIFGDDFNVVDNSAHYKGVSPIYNIPQASERKLPPQLLTVGSADELVTPASVKEYREKLTVAGHYTEYWEYEGRSHAFLDSGSNLLLGTSFEDDAPEALNVMIRFLNGVFYR